MCDCIGHGLGIAVAITVGVTIFILILESLTSRPKKTKEDDKILDLIKSNSTDVNREFPKFK